jgi:uncharacterized protein involved in exopolysaccharide biosynthesis
MDVRRYIESALRLKWRLLAAALLVAGVAFGALFFAKQGYSSSATVWVEPGHHQGQPQDGKQGHRQR